MCFRKRLLEIDLLYLEIVRDRGDRDILEIGSRSREIAGDPLEIGEIFEIMETSAPAPEMRLVRREAAAIFVIRCAVYSAKLVRNLQISI